MILVRDELEVIPVALSLARSTLRVIHGNLVWAFGHNIAAIPLAAAGTLNPLLAGAAMTMSSMFVLTNSLRLQKLYTPTDRRPGTSVHAVSAAPAST